MIFRRPPVQILIIEENVAEGESVSKAMRKFGIENEIQSARSGAEALDLLFGAGAFKGRDVRQTPGVILLDTKLSKVRGLEVLRRIREHLLTKSIPVIVLTSFEFDDELTKSQQLGISGFLVKPVDVAKLMQMMRRAGLSWMLSAEKDRFLKNPRGCRAEMMAIFLLL